MNKKKSQVRRLSWLRFVASVFKGIIFVAALVVIAHELEGVRLHDVFIQLRRIGRWHLVVGPWGSQDTARSSLRMPGTDCR